MALRVGDALPEFRGKTLDGEITHEDLAGENAIVYFYPRDNTPGCTTEACDFRDNIENFKKAGIKIYGVSTDSLESHKKFADKYDLNFPLISDEDASICKAFDIWIKKSMYGREYMGTNRTTFFIGKDGVIQEVWGQVKVKEHVDKVLRRSKEILE